MPPQRPSRDWPIRTTPLDGTEWLLKQNAIADITPFPKEEMVATDLLVEKSLSDITSFSVDDNILSLNFSNRDSISIPLTSIRGIYDMTASGSVLTFLQNDGEQESIDLAPLLTNEIYVNGATLVGTNLILSRENSTNVVIDLAPLNNTLSSITFNSTTRVLSFNNSNSTAVTVSAFNYGRDYRINSIQYINNNTIRATLVSNEIINSQSLEYVRLRNMNFNISPLNQPIVVGRQYEYEFRYTSTLGMKQIGIYLYNAGQSTVPNRKVVFEVSIGNTSPTIYTIEMFANETYKFLNLNTYFGTAPKVIVTVLQNDFTTGDTLPSGAYFNGLYAN